MKTSLTKLSSSILLLSFSLAVFAKPVAQVVDVSGTVFVVTPEGKTTTLKVNQHIEDRSEVMVEEGAAITLNDYFNATYHLTGGSHLKLFNKSVQLKRGKTWIQSMNSKGPLALTTANSHVNFWKGEFITTFDQASNKSQVLVVNGEVEVSNILDQNMKYTVPAGSFTLVDPEVENGIPRSPTKVGLQSLNTALEEFKQLPEEMKRPSPARGIASVSAEVPVKKGEIIFIKSTARKPASVEGKVAQKYLSKITAKRSRTAPVKIHYYGFSAKKAEARNPASIRIILPSAPQKTAPIIKNDPEFADSLKKHATQQPKYSKELESLIDDLRSY